MAGTRRARTGRGWDAAPRRPQDPDSGTGRTARTAGRWWSDGTPFPADDPEASGLVPESDVRDAPIDAGSGDGGAADSGSGEFGSGEFGSGPGRRGSGGFGGRSGGAAGRGSRGSGRGRGGPGGRFGARSDQSDQPAPEVSPAEKAREICLRLLSFRPRTRAELATALGQRGIEPEVVAEVLDRYDEVGIIDDGAFARAWVTSRHHGRGLARRALADELRRKGVDSEAAGTALDELDPETEAQTARALVDRKLRSDRGGPPDAVFRRLVGMLARKGYSAGLATRVVKDALRDRAEAESFEAAALEVAALEEEALAEASLDDSLATPSSFDS